MLHLQTGKLLFKSQFHSEPITAVAFSPDGTWLATGSNDKSIMLYNVQTRNEARRMHLPQPVAFLHFIDDGKELLVIGRGGVKHQFALTTPKGP